MHRKGCFEGWDIGGNSTGRCSRHARGLETIDDIGLRTGPYGLIRVRAKSANGESWQPKTKVNRAIPISGVLRQYLDQYTPRLSEGNWYFRSPAGKRWDSDNFSRDLREANQQTGLQWACLDHGHTFGSQLATKGESL